MSDLIDEVNRRVAILSASSAWGADWDAHLMSSLVRRNEALEAKLAVAREALGNISAIARKAIDNGAPNADYHHFEGFARAALKEIEQ